MKKLYITPNLIAKEVKLDNIIMGSTEGPRYAGKGESGDEAESKTTDFIFGDDF